MESCWNMPKKLLNVKSLVTLTRFVISYYYLSSHLPVVQGVCANCVTALSSAVYNPDNRINWSLCNLMTDLSWIVKVNHLGQTQKEGIIGTNDGDRGLVIVVHWQHIQVSAVACFTICFALPLQFVRFLTSWPSQRIPSRSGWWSMATLCTQRWSLSYSWPHHGSVWLTANTTMVQSFVNKCTLQISSFF